MVERLSDIQIQQFINDGYVKLEGAFSTVLAEKCRALLWKDIPCDLNDRSTWAKSVIRLGDYDQEPFRQTVDTDSLHRVFDQLAGAGNWVPRKSMGAFIVRFPSVEDPGDTGWHVDAGFPVSDPNNFMNWRINIFSKGRALLMLFLFSDVGVDDAPTRINVGSHIPVARLLKATGESGLSFMDLAQKLHEIPIQETHATGKAGTIYLCHPFLAHAAQPHRGTNPRFIAQPPLLSEKGFDILKEAHECHPVAWAIRIGIGSR